MRWLKSLSTSEQVAFLFVVLFGALMLVSIGSVLWSLRERPEEEQEAWQSRWARFRHELNMVWVGACLFWAAWVSGPVGATLLFGVFSFLAFREFITLLHTRRADHRGLILAFFVILPLQYVLVGTRHFDLFSVLIPVYGFLAIPVASALADDPGRFLERNSKIQWGIMVCVYGLSHAPALLLLEFPKYEGRGAFLLFFLVAVVACGQLAQAIATSRFRAKPVARRISRSFTMKAWAIGAFAAAVAGALLYWITPFKAGQAAITAFVAAGCGSFGVFVMQALKRDAGIHAWGNRSAITGAVGLLDRIAVMCFAAPVFFHSVRWYFRAGT